MNAFDVLVKVKSGFLSGMQGRAVANSCIGRLRQNRRFRGKLVMGNLDAPISIY
jgi:hypothetical protein